MGIGHWLLGAIALATACNNSKFNDSSNPNPQPTSAQATAASPTPAKVGSGCTTVGSTAAKLLTDSVTNGAPGQIIKYELSMNDCDGVQTPITASEIKFDINAVYVGAATGSFGPPLPYTIQSVDGSRFSTGNFLVIQGSDLFGNIDATHWYYKTSNPINIPKDVEKVILNVDISNETDHLPNHKPGDPYPPTELISTYLAFGTANPVEQPVTFKNK